jgi:hypothetical protein
MIELLRRIAARVGSITSFAAPLPGLMHCPVGPSQNRGPQPVTIAPHHATAHSALALIKASDREIGHRIVEER